MTDKTDSAALHGFQSGLLEAMTQEEAVAEGAGLRGQQPQTESPISYGDLLKLFWEQHDPAQGMRQGGDVGTQYRSVIFYDDESQEAIAQQSLAAFQQAMAASGDVRAITTRILPLAPFYYAEDYHQQYLKKNPEGYCGLGGIGVCLPPSLNR